MDDKELFIAYISSGNKWRVWIYSYGEIIEKLEAFETKSEAELAAGQWKKEFRHEEPDSPLDYIRDSYPDSLLADGFDGAVMGVASGCDSGRVVYSIQKMLDILFNESDMPYDEAMEFLEFNTISAYVGEFTPIYLDDV